MGHYRKHNIIYSNIKVKNPKGELIFTCSRNRANWYLQRNLAVEENHKTIRLTFLPGGNGNINDSYFLSEKENKCIVCGTDKKLTTHHIVPACYRKHMSEDIKAHNCYDILPLCKDDHKKYEKYARVLKINLCNMYGIPIDGHIRYDDKVKIGAIKSAKTLIRYGHKLPEDRKQLMFNSIEKYIYKNPSLLDLLRLCKTPYKESVCLKTSGQMVMEHIKDVPAFIFMWRNHFIRVMQPKYMPKYWTIDRPVYRIDK